MKQDRKQRTVFQLVGVIVVMGALAWASVPAYNLFCKVTGFGGTTDVAEAGSDVILDKTIKVRFDASKERDFPWEFKPVAHEMEIRIGETGLAFYEAYNPTDQVIAGTASYNVVPYDAGGFFTKIDCFCFTEQTLEPGQTIDMPVTFYVDPEIYEKVNTRDVKTITLSYTFYPKEEASKVSALRQPSKAGEKG